MGIRPSCAGELTHFPKEKTVTIIEIIDTFTFYGIDVILLSSLTTLAVQFLKITVLKNVKKKLLTFLPFIIGTIFYAVYQGVYNSSFYFVLDNYTLVLEHGVSIGAVSTLTYVLYEQFVREKDALTPVQSVISTLIEGYVPSDAVEKTAKEIALAIEKDVTGNGAKKAAQIILENAGENVEEKDVALLAKLIIETIAHITIV